MSLKERRYEKMQLYINIGSKYGKQIGKINKIKQIKHTLEILNFENYLLYYMCTYIYYKNVFIVCMRVCVCARARVCVCECNIYNNILYNIFYIINIIYLCN